MKAYSRKFAIDAVKKQTRVTAESRDAILWDVDWINKIARVKIQGSNEYIRVHFPRNESRIQSFMRPGNSVRVIHRGGIRGRLEIVGHGMSIPTPVPGYPAGPDPPCLPDGIVSGCEITATNPLSMSVDIAAGTYRINCVVYSLVAGSFGLSIMSEASSPMTMNEAYPPAVMGANTASIVMSETLPPMTMSETNPPAIIGAIATTAMIDPAPPAGQFRYDGFAVGVDGVIDYIKGTASSNPAYPAIPSAHIQIVPWILVVGGVTEINQGDIGRIWTARTPAAMTLTVPATFAWDFGNDYPEVNVTAQMNCQYGWTLDGNYTITLRLAIGTGNVWSSQSGYNASVVTQSFSASSYAFKYQRDQTASPEKSPLLLATESSIVSNVEFIQLKNSVGGDII